MQFTARCIPLMAISFWASKRVRNADGMFFPDKQPEAAKESQ